jgi:uracil-DNA glycosylase family protein
MIRANLIERAVRRDIHKMKAFVRFRPVRNAVGEPVHIAWFEPEHYIVAATAPFFIRRFAQMRWAIMTPDLCVQWDGHQLTYSSGAQRGDAPEADAGESLWLTYYAHIFNPARLKLAMMRKEMPRKYWPNLPEAALISGLTAQAITRSGQMIEAEPNPPKRRVVRLATSDRLRLPLHNVATLEELAQAAQHCRDCAIGECATQAVWGQGPLGARLMIVGEQPGDEEDLHGQPFVGPAGRLLDRALANLGWERSALYITNAVKHFKFELRGKRRLHKTATQHEVAVCADNWLSREIALIRPQGIVALGATAARALVGRSVRVITARGQWMPGVGGIPVLITLHPAALLRMAIGERQAAFERWCDDLSQAATLARTENNHGLGTLRAKEPR